MKRKKELIVILSSLLVIVLSVSVAYFTTKILGTGKEISVESADLKVIFTSGSGTINGTDVEPGWSSGEDTFTVKNESNGTYKYNIIIKDLVNTFVTEGFLQYKITSTDGGYNMTDFADVPKSSTATDTVLAENISIEKGTTHTYKIVINYNNSDDVDQSEDMGKTLSGKIFITKASNPTLASKILEDNPTISTRNDFSAPFTTNTVNTLYKATENGTDVYYFAGQDTTSTPINNWVKFGKTNKVSCIYNGNQVKVGNYDHGFEKIISASFVENQSQCEVTGICVTTDFGPVVGVTSSECSDHGGTWVSETATYNGLIDFDTYWRVIRTNADGSVRMLYSGTSPDTTESFIGTSEFNTYETESPKYVGYMYGDSDTTLEEARTNTNDSTIKIYIDNWYENNLTAYTNYLSNDAIFCNDRELASGSAYSTSSSNYFYFKSYERLKTNKTPTYDCTNNKDAFSVNNAEAKLKYPIALMTADEIAYAGGVYKQSAPMWYYTNSTYNSIIGLTSWWLLSPSSWNVGTWVEIVNSSNPSGAIGAFGVYQSYAVRPVVSLKTCIKYSTGNGSSSSPYEIVENGGC